MENQRKFKITSLNYIQELALNNGKFCDNTSSTLNFKSI